MTVLRVRGRALPDDEPIDLYADGDRLALLDDSSTVILRGSRIPRP
jgi:hypothetical protein